MPGEVDAEAVRQSPLWSHMVKLLAEVVSERPQDALGAMSATSHYLLTGSTVPPKAASAYADPHPVCGRSAVASDALHNSCWASHFVTAVAPPKPPRCPLNGENAGEDEDNNNNNGHNSMRRDDDGGEDEEEAVPYDMRVDLEAERQAGELPGSVADVVAEQAVFNQLGVGVPPAEALRLVVGLRQLMKAEPLERVRFWGKIFGSRADYYVAEAKIDAARVPERDDANDELGDEAEDEEGAAVTESIAEVLFSYAVRRHHSVVREAAGTGLNEFVYYVALDTDPTRWTRLPDVTPQQVSAARLIRRGFTGNLQAPVLSHPRFPGLEQHYLRAQIARIHCGCKVAPRDLYLTEGAVPEAQDEDEMETVMSGAANTAMSANNAAGEDGAGGAQNAVTKVPAYAAVPPLLPQEMPEEEDAEAIQPVQTWYHGYANDELLQGKYWVHIAPTLLQNGRVTTAPPGGNDGGAGGGGANAAEEMEMTGGEAGEAGEVAEELIHPFLSDVAKDEPLAFPGHSRASFQGWSFRKGFHNESNLTRVYVARSGRWPGAFTYAVTRKGKPGAQYQMVYVGTGLKNLQGIDYTPQFPPAKMHEYGEEGLVLQRDCTIDEELEYAPPPPRPRVDEDEENDGQDDDGRY